MDWTLNNHTLKNIFDVVTLGEMLVLLTMYFGAKRPGRILPELLAFFVSGSVVLILVMKNFRILDIYMLFGMLMVMTSLCALFSLRGKWSYKLTVCLYFCVTYLQLHTAELVLWSILLPAQPFSRIGLSQAGMCFVLLANRHFGAWYSEDTPPVYMFTLFLSSLSSLIVCLIALPMLVPEQAFNAASLILCIGLMVTNMTAFYQGQQLMRAYREKLEWRTVADRIHADNHLVEESNRLLDQLRTRRHERANQALVIRALCDAGDMPGLRAYIDQICPEETQEESIDCGHLIVNAVLNQKTCRYARAKVPLEIDAHLPPRLPIRDSDLCSLLANLLDNALEGSLNEAQPQVGIRISCVKNYLRVTVKNRVSRDVLAENPELSTTKENADEHGVGVRVIRQIAERYDGMLDFAVQDGWFMADVLLKLNGY